MREKWFRLVQAPWLIAAVALLLRLAWLYYKITQIPREALASVPFQNEVGNVAYALATGHGFCCLFRQPTGPTAWLAPVYPLLIATIFKLFDAFTFRAFCVAVTLNSLASALACFPLFYAAKRIAGKSTAVLAAWLWAVSPIAVILPCAWIWDTSVSTFLAAAILWATLRIAESPRHRDFALYGLLWGISLLTNPTLAALLPFLLIWLLFQGSTHTERCHPERAVGAKDLNVSVMQPTSDAPASLRSFGPRLRRVLVSLAVILAALLPWTLRNYAQLHSFIPLRSNFRYEFWSGNNEIFDPDSRAINRITRYEQTALYARLGETAFLDEKWQSAKTFVRTHPRLYAQLCVNRIVATWFGSDSPLHDFLNADSTLARLLLAWNALTFFAVSVGLFRFYLRSRAYFFLLAAFPAVFPITFYLAHTSLRHRHPIDPVLCLLVALAFRGRRAES